MQGTRISPCFYTAPQFMQCSPFSELDRNTVMCPMANRAKALIHKINHRHEGQLTDNLPIRRRLHGLKCAACSSVCGAWGSLKSQQTGVLNEVHPKSSNRRQLRCMKSVSENPLPVALRFAIGNSGIF